MPEFALARIMLTFTSLIILGLILVILISRAYLASLMAVREAPGAEAGLDGLWASFDRAFWPRIRQGWMIYVLYLAIPFALGLWNAQSSIVSTWKGNLFFLLGNTVGQLGTVALIIAACGVWAPFCRRVWSLTGLTIVTVMVIYGGWNTIFERIVFGPENEPITDMHGTIASINLRLCMTNLSLLVGAMVILGALAWWQRRGTKWFRISTRISVTDMR